MSGDTRSNLFQLGAFILNSGASSRWKIECDSLTDDDWDCLSEMVRQVVGPFSVVEGVPRGGLKLADKLNRHVSRYGPLLIVDDVLTTGNSLERQRAGRDAVGVVVFSRGRRPLWVRALFQLHKSLWLP